nr:prepilin peptidase [uncultured Lachnoclostridium sp.]
MVILQAVLLTALLTYASVRDMWTREIPPYLCMGVALLSLLDFQVENLLGLGIPLILLLAATYICPNKLGGGDIKLSASVSLVIGFTATAYGMIIAFSIVVLIYFSLNPFSKKQEVRNLSLPLAPFMAVGFLITYFMKIGGYIL